jgi:hypothetical protein
MKEKEEKIAYLANRYIEKMIPLGVNLFEWLRTQPIEKTEEIYLRNIIPSAETIKQSDEFPLLEDQITFLEKASASYDSLFFYFQEEFKGEREVRNLEIGSKEWNLEFDTQHKVLQTLRFYIANVNEVLQQKIKKSLIAQIDKNAASADLKNRSAEGHAEENDTAVHKMQWMGSEKQLITLFETLMKKDLIKIDENRKWKILAEHFINKKGDAFKHRQLSTVAQKTSQDEGVVIHIVDKIAKEPSE